jgi:hypothetical protein
MGHVTSVAPRFCNKKVLQRQKPRREPYDRVLIVCEGSKTEPNYLDELIRFHQLSSANVTITGDCGSTPDRVVEKAIEIFENDKDYDRVYCVLDRDAHPTFDAAIQRVRSKSLVRYQGKCRRGTAEFKAIVSTPCFEYWLLLHHRYTRKVMLRCEDVERELRSISEFSNYKKGEKGLYLRTRDYLEQALQYADRANQDAELTGAKNPSTEMPELIRYLLELAKRKGSR